MQWFFWTVSEPSIVSKRENMTSKEVLCNSVGEVLLNWVVRSAERNCPRVGFWARERWGRLTKEWRAPERQGGRSNRRLDWWMWLEGYSQAFGKGECLRMMTKPVVILRRKMITNGQIVEKGVWGWWPVGISDVWCIWEAHRAKRKCITKCMHCSKGEHFLERLRIFQRSCKIC